MGQFIFGNSVNLIHVRGVFESLVVGSHLQKKMKGFCS